MFIVTKCNESPGDGIIKEKEKKEKHFTNIVSFENGTKSRVDERLPVEHMAQETPVTVQMKEARVFCQDFGADFERKL